MKLFISPVIILGTSLLLASCTSLKTPNAHQTHYKTISWKKRQLALSQIQHWDINGAFSIQQHDKTNIAAYEWKQDKKNYQIRIHSSFNLYSVILTGAEGKASLSRASEKAVTASTPEKLMQKELGWSLPLNNLQYWIRGLPGPSKHTSEFDPYGHLTSLDQQGWQIRFSRYLSVDGVDLPQLIMLNQGTLHVKIAIKHWKAN